MPARSIAVAIKDNDVFQLIDKIADHYVQNVSNQHVRKAFSNLPISNTTWELIEDLTGKKSYRRAQGYSYQELYERIHAAASFVATLRTHLVPNLRDLVSRAPAGQEVVVKMVVANFPTNLSILADMLNDLYLRTIALDRDENSPPYYESRPEMSQIGQLLIG
jgi:hypothetical protein